MEVAFRIVSVGAGLTVIGNRQRQSKLEVATLPHYPAMQAICKT